MRKPGVLGGEEIEESPARYDARRLGFLGSREAMSTHGPTDLQSADEPTDELPRDDDVAVADTGAGLLVYEVEREHRAHLGRDVQVARVLIGFADVEDWSVIRDALRARGHGVGATTHLPEYDVDRLPPADA